MKLLLCFLFCIPLIQAECPDQAERCQTTNYEEYVECTRNCKFDVDQKSCLDSKCVRDCNGCDCSSCAGNNCEATCNGCCYTQNQNCKTTYCCYKKCHTECPSTSCRKSCRKTCQHDVNNKTEVVNVKRSDFNVTTVIKVENVVNTTNFINWYPTVNTSNIKIEHDCCEVIGPSNCSTASTVIAPITCQYNKTKECGDICESPKIHVEPQDCNAVDAPDNCTPQLHYIPQPQPRCAYQSYWPFVYCGIQSLPFCEGCYEHYVNPYSRSFESCPPGCYDDGYGVGPLFRQGPFYRRRFHHQFSCYQVGLCKNSNGSSINNNIESNYDLSELYSFIKRWIERNIPYKP